jgi:hypothetical protein
MVRRSRGRAITMYSWVGIHCSGLSRSMIGEASTRSSRRCRETRSRVARRCRQYRELPSSWLISCPVFSCFLRVRWCQKQVQQWNFAFFLSLLSFFFFSLLLLLLLFVQKIYFPPPVSLLPSFSFRCLKRTKKSRGKYGKLSRHQSRHKTTCKGKVHVPVTRKYINAGCRNSDTVHIKLVG